MRILHYHAELSLARGGVVRAVLDLAAALARAGHEVTILTSRAPDAPASWRDGSAGAPRVVEIDAPAAPAGRLPRRALAAAATHLARADVLHLHGLWRLHHVQLAALARRRGVPYVVSAHGMLDDWSISQRALLKRAYLALGGRRVLEGAAVVHCTAADELAQARRRFPRGHGAVVPLILDLEPFRRLPGPELARTRFPRLDTGEPTLLFLSRLHPKKGVERLIDAAGRLRGDGVPCRVLVAGGGDERYVERLRSLIADGGLEEVVTLLGFVAGVEKISLYQAADLFVLPTSQENFGFVLFEALAAETPVVTTREVDTWPELEESGGAVLVAPDAGAIAGAVRALLEDPQRRRAMGRAGRAWVTEHLTAERVVSDFERLYAAAARPARADGA